MNLYNFPLNNQQINNGVYFFKLIIIFLQFVLFFHKLSLVCFQVVQSAEQFHLLKVHNHSIRRQLELGLHKSCDVEELEYFARFIVNVLPSLTEPYQRPVFVKIIFSVIGKSRLWRYLLSRISYNPLFAACSCLSYASSKKFSLNINVY